MKEWLSRNFDERNYPSWSQNGGVLLGSALGAVGGVPGVIIGGVLGGVVGHIGGALIQSDSFRTLSPKRLAKQKLLQDFHHTSVKLQMTLDAASSDLDGRAQIMTDHERVDRETPVRADESIHVPARTHFRHPTENPDEPDNAQLIEDAAALATERASQPIIVNCSSIAVGTVAALKGLISHYNLPIQIDYGDPFGISQVRTLGGDPDRQTDFLIAPEAPFLLATENKLDDYFRLAPVFGEEQRVVKRNGESQHVATHYITDSTGDEQVTIGVGITQNSDAVPFVDLNEIANIVSGLGPGDSLVLWEPLASVFGRRFGFHLDGPHYTNWFALYAQKRWLVRNRRRWLRCFTRLFVDEWRYNIRHPKIAYQHVKNDKAFLDAFAIASVRL